MKKIICSLLASLILSCNLNAASYILDSPEKIKEGNYPALIQNNKSINKGIVESINEVLKLYTKEPIVSFDQVMVQIEDRVLIFKKDVVHLNKLLETSNVKLKNYRALNELFPTEPSGISRMFKTVAPYGIRMAPSALIFGAPISVALVSQGIITDVIIGKKEKSYIRDLKSKINEQELRLNNLENELNQLKRKENNEEVVK